MILARSVSTLLEGLRRFASTVPAPPRRAGGAAVLRIPLAAAGSALVLSVVPGPPATADEAKPPPNLATIDAVLESVSSEYPGQVLHVELEEEEDTRSGWAYEVKVLTSDGQVIEVKLDAVSTEWFEVEGASWRRSDER